MSTTKSKRSATGQIHPKKAWGPFAGGTKLACWLNQVPTDDGPRYFRSFTLTGRRFRDKKTGEWKDGALRPSDLPALILAFEAALSFVANTPLPGEAAEEEVEAAANAADGPIPF